MLLSLFILASSPGLLAETGGISAELSLALSSAEATRFRADIRGGASRLALAASADDTETRMAFSAAYSAGASGSIAVGSLHAGPMLMLLLDPLASELGGQAPFLALADGNLDSSMGGCLIASGALGFFALGRGSLGTGTVLMDDEEAEEEDEGAPGFVAGGGGAQFRLGSDFVGFSLGIGRSKEGSQPSSWYDALLPGSWPRSLASLYFWAPRASSRVALALVGSSAIDMGQGLALRFEFDRRMAEASIRTAIMARSPRFLGWSEKTESLASGELGLGLPLGNGLRLSLQTRLEALELLPEPSLHLGKDFGLGLEAEGESTLPARLRLEGSWKSGLGEGAVESRLELGLGEREETLTLGLSTALEWAGNSAPFPEAASGFSSLLLPEFLKLRLDGRLPRIILSAGCDAAIRLTLSLERKQPFVAAQADAMTAIAGWVLEFRASGAFTFTMRADFEGKAGPTFLSSLGRAPGRLQAGLRVGLGR